MNIKNTSKRLTSFFSDNPKISNYLPQTLTLLFIVFVIGYFTYNAQVNMDNRGIDFGFHFWGQEASFDIQFSLIEYDGSHSYGRAYLVGVLNTILVAVIGIFFATILQTIPLKLAFYDENSSKFSTRLNSANWINKNIIEKEKSICNKDFSPFCLL